MYARSSKCKYGDGGEMVSDSDSEILWEMMGKWREKVGKLVENGGSWSETEEADKTWC